MGNILEGGIEDLEMAKAKIIEKASKEEALKTIEAEAKTKEKDWTHKQKEMEDKISSSIKERRDEIKKKYDEAVDEATKGLKEAEKKKKDAKAAAVNDRVKNETADLVSQNENLKNQNKELFKNNGVPAFCNSFFYYSLFAPKTGKNFLVFAAVVIAALGVIPNIVCLCIHTNQVIVKVLVYALIVVIFAGIYVLFFFLTKGKGKGAIIEQGRANIEHIGANKAQIKKIEKGIRSDKDESQYGLGAFDDEIKTAQDMVNAKTADRDGALKEFDDQVATSIRKEIEEADMPAITQLETEYKDLAVKVEDQKIDLDAITKAISEDYGAFLGSGNLDVDRIDSMIYLLKSGKAANIQEAIEVINTEKLNK